MSMGSTKARSNKQKIKVLLTSILVHTPPFTTGILKYMKFRKEGRDQGCSDFNKRQC